MAMQLESRLREALERLRLGDRTSAAASGTSVGNSEDLEVTLQQLLSATQAQATRLAKMEASCFTSPGAGVGLNTKTGFQLPENEVAGHQEQDVIARGVALEGMLIALQQIKVELEEVLRSSRKRHLPAGKSPTEFLLDYTFKHYTTRFQLKELLLLSHASKQRCTHLHSHENVNLAYTHTHRGEGDVIIS